MCLPLAARRAIVKLDCSAVRMIGIFSVASSIRPSSMAGLRGEQSAKDVRDVASGLSPSGMSYGPGRDSPLTAG
jgi:hypothetical protein